MPLSSLHVLAKMMNGTLNRKGLSSFSIGGACMWFGPDSVCIPELLADGLVLQQ